VVFFDCTINDRWRIGEIDGGAQPASFGLAAEHTGAGDWFMARALRAAVGWALTASVGTPAIPAAEDWLVKDRLGRAAMLAEVGQLMNQQCLVGELADNGGQAGQKATLIAKESWEWTSQAIMDLVGHDALFFDGPSTSPSYRVQEQFRLAPGGAIYGGTTEIIRSIIAEKCLGLPRSRP
jgi:hypothetical protein